MIQGLFMLFQFLVYAISAYSVVIVIYVLMSWVPNLRETKFGELIGKIAEPYLDLFRRFIPPLGMIDISPIVAILALRLIQNGLANVFNIVLRWLI